MLTRQIRTKHNSLSRWVGSAVAGLLLTTAIGRAGFFTGEFAPANWTFSGSPSDIVWNPLPPADPTSVTVYAPHLVNGISTLALQPVAGGYVVSFRATFNSMSAPSASLLMNAPGYAGEIVGIFPGDTMPVVKTYSVTMSPGDSISFAMTADTTGIGDKKNVPFFSITEWDVQVIPEASTWIAAVGLLMLCGFQFKRSWRNNRSEQPAVG